MENQKCNSNCTCNEGVCCDVCTCFHNIDGCKCSLDEIKVTKGSGVSAHYCGSYEDNQNSNLV